MKVILPKGWKQLAGVPQVTEATTGGLWKALKDAQDKAESSITQLADDINNGRFKGPGNEVDGVIGNSDLLDAMKEVNTLLDHYIDLAKKTNM